MSKNSFSRYIWLIDLINRRGYIKMSEISDAWQRCSLNDKHQDSLPERTFFNHRDAISEIFGLDIELDKELGYHIPTSQMNNNGARAWLFQTLSINNIINESTNLRDKILFESVPSAIPFLGEIINIIRDGNAMNLTYQSYKNREPYTFEAHPYCLKMFKQRWYVLAKTPKYDYPTIYSLDRVKDVEELDIKAEIPQDFNAEEYFRPFYGIITGEGEDPQPIKIKVKPDQAHYFRSLPLHHSQMEIEPIDNYPVFSYFVVPSHDFIQEILSHGDDVQVLEPKELADTIKIIAAKMVKLYKKQ